MTGDIPVLVGLLDSGIGGGARTRVVAAKAFGMTDRNEVTEQPAAEDRVGHGSVLAGHILAAAPDAELLDAQVFGDGMASAPKLIAAGLDWLAGQGARVVNMSFGLREDRLVLRESCRAAAAAGVVLVAAAPARGPSPYPAAYPETLSVQGDARCALGEVSRLGGSLADFGTFCQSLDPLPEGVMVGGASWAASHFTGLVAAYLAAVPQADTAKVRHHFARGAVYVGPEHKKASPLPQGEDTT